MRRGRTAWRYGVVGVGVLLALAGVTLSTVSVPFGFGLFTRPSPRNLMTMPVRRTDFNVTMMSGGRVDSSDKTIIECRLENVDFRVRGGAGMTVGGASTILTVVPDGTMVKKDDVLCELDASSYIELVRQQEINVERAKAEFSQATLDLDVARMAETEYRDGLMLQTLKNLNGQIALIESDMERANDRLAWSRRMVDKGYVARSQVTTEEFSLDRLKHNLMKGKTSLDLFEKFSAPKYQFILKSDVLRTEAILNYQTRKLQRFEEQLALYQKQVDRCTIRAPHDGMVIHANEEMRNVRIEAGMTVRQRQRLFYLPNLAQMEVATMLHESVVRDVKPGMKARVKVEALPNRVLEGVLESVTQLPNQHWFSDVKYFVGTVKLHTVPRGLTPGMSAEVELVTAFKPDTLVIPSEALTVEEGQDVCYVARNDALERREVKVGQTSGDYLEVTEGLDEGEDVVLDPEQALTPITIAEIGETAAHEQHAEAPATTTE